MGYVVPDFLYWTNQSLNGNYLNRDNIPYSVSLDWDDNYTTSFISLLFNESYDSTSYDYLYEPITVVSQWDRTLLVRAKIFSNSVYYKLNPNATSGTNLFEINSDDILILNKLLEYRLYPGNTNLNNIPFDSTALLGVQEDSTSYINYEEINETLIPPPPSVTNILYSLIYIYLDYKINDDKSLYDNFILFSKDNTQTPRGVLECFFEAYLINTIFEDFVTENKF